jgi:hypothetical protein
MNSFDYLFDKPLFFKKFNFFKKKIQNSTYKKQLSAAGFKI